MQPEFLLTFAETETPDRDSHFPLYSFSDICNATDNRHHICDTMGFSTLWIFVL